MLFFAACDKDKKQTEYQFEEEEEEVVENVPLVLPYNEIALNDLSSFQPTEKNWSIVGNVIANIDDKNNIKIEDGSGILFNANDQEKNKNLLTNFEHGDIELELDVMMPKGSNSGIYFQGRYEIQLFDSWGVAEPKFSDIGGIYQRWNKDAEKGKEGYEGHPPRVNASKAPGLWQHLKIIFHASNFDSEGNKIKNAWFEEVWLNGVLLHENVEVTGPTRAAMFKDEKPLGPLMIQGDHGPVAFKNIKYKLYEDNQIKLSDLTKKIYESPSKEIGNLDTIPLKSEASTDVFSFVKDMKEKSSKMVVYSGTMTIPVTGNYLFDVRSNGVAKLLLSDSILMDIRGGIEIPNIKTILLEAGDIPFQFIYNQNRPWMQGLSFHVEGPNMQKYSLQQGVTKNEGVFNPLEGIIVEPEDKPVMQRSFIDFKGKKLTHCISVGTPEGIHYSYNLATGSLLKIWSGAFLNTTHMWLSRGKDQLGEPIGFSISMHGNAEFANLKDENTRWPSVIKIENEVKQLGYELDATGMPSFIYQIGETTITNKFQVSSENRKLSRTIDVVKGENLWHKIAEGEHIQMLPDNIFIVNNESYYIHFSANDLKPIIRKSKGKDELLVQIPKEKSSINYSIIW